MSYILLILLFISILWWREKHNFRWETVIRNLWKQIYFKADQMASHMKQFSSMDSRVPQLEGFKAQVEFRGKLVNSILDYINILIKEEDARAAEETFGFGRYEFGKVLDTAMKNPEYYRKIK